MLIKARCLHNANTVCNECLLRALCLPGTLDPAEFQTVVDIIENSRSVHRGEHVFTAGQPFTSIYVVKSGAIKTVLRSDRGAGQITGFYLPSEAFGLDSVAFPKYSNSAIALETSAVCEITYAKLTSLGKEIPALHKHFMAMMSLEIHRDQELITLLSKYNAEERVASLLLSISSRNQKRKLSPLHLRLPMSRGDIGNHLGLTVETVSRVLSRFQKQGLIRVDKKDLEIRDHEGLRAKVCP